MYSYLSPPCSNHPSFSWQSGSIRSVRIVIIFLLIHWHAEFKIVPFQFSKILNVFSRKQYSPGNQDLQTSRYKVVGTASANSATGSLTGMMREAEPGSSHWFLEPLLFNPCTGSEPATMATLLAHCTSSRLTKEKLVDTQKIGHPIYLVVETLLWLCLYFHSHSWEGQHCDSDSFLQNPNIALQLSLNRVQDFSFSISWL